MRSVLESIRNPAYTGERRCWPCTALNGALLAVVCAVAALRSPPLAVGGLVAGSAVIGLRGYLVPYTPRIAPRLASRLPGDPFHAEAPVRSGTLDAATDSTDSRDSQNSRNSPESADSPDEAAEGESVLAALFAADVLVESDDRLFLSENFRKRWDAETRAVRELPPDELTDAALAAAPGATHAEVRELDGDPWVVLSDGTGNPAAETWLARPVAVADVASVRALLAMGVDAEVRTRAAGPLREFLETCPVCDGEVVETTTEHCCGGAPNPLARPTEDVLACADCGARLYTFPEPEAENGP